MGEQGYWCHMCMDAVEPVAGEEEMICPNCGTGFVEEMGNGTERDEPDDGQSSLGNLVLSLLGQSGPRQREEDEEEDDDGDGEEEEEDEQPGVEEEEGGGSSFLDLEDRLISRRRARIFRLLQRIRDDLRITLNHAASISGMDADDVERERRARREWRERERARREREWEAARRTDFLVIDSGNEAILIRSTFTRDDDDDEPEWNRTLGGYRIGQGLDMLLQRLLESDASHYGTPPAKKEAVESLPLVRIDEALSCTVCLEEFAVGDRAKQMPCHHKFHTGCLLPWLEIHSSCPVCRFQLPADHAKEEVASAAAEEAQGTDGRESSSASSS